MTAEVAILNRYGLAIAADSAVTIGSERVWKTTNKIFSLGPQHDIGIMVYGSGDFCGFPWEIVIKAFKRKYAKRKQFRKLEECLKEFRNYLDDSRWNNPIHERLCSLSIIIKELGDLRNRVPSQSSKSFRKAINDTLDQWISEASSLNNCIESSDMEMFYNEFGGDIEIFRKELFSEHFPKYLNDKLVRYLFSYVSSEECVSGYESGVVLCGYGESEDYPVLLELTVDGRYSGKTRCWEARSANLNTDGLQAAQIIPFAQRDMTNLFMEGISPAYRTYVLKMMALLLENKTKSIIDNFLGNDDEKLVERAIQKRTDLETLKLIKKDLLDFREKKFVQPLMSNVQGLPREEMAAMAESLVELTSLRRKIDSVVQSVAGPVDVAFISKSDGFIWMKRKHYFRRDLNDEFFIRKQNQES